MGTYLSFHFYFILLCGLSGRQNPLFIRFFIFCWLSLGLVVWSRLGDLFVAQRTLNVSFSRTDSGLCTYYLWVRPSLTFLHTSQWITFLAQSYLVLLIWLLLSKRVWLANLTDGFSLESKWQQVSSGLQDWSKFSCAVVRMVSNFPLMSCSRDLFFRLFGVVPMTPTKISITVTFMFHNFFSSLAMSKYLSHFSSSSSFSLYSAGIAKSIIGSVGWGCRIHQLHLCRGIRLL